MAGVNQNMFDASIVTDRPGGASLMVLPLNLIAQIVSNVSFSTMRSRNLRKNTDSNQYHRFMTLPIWPDSAGHVAFSTIWRCHSFIGA